MRCLLFLSSWIPGLTPIDETKRARLIQENQLLLSGLLGPRVPLAPSASTSTVGPTPRQKTRKALLDRNGYIISEPAPGQTFRMACIELPSDRKTKRRITDGEYEDCSAWADGEAHRRRYGDGDGEYQEGEEVVVGGVAPDFRWRHWQGLHRELRREMRLRGELNEDDIRGAKTRSMANDEDASAYSVGSRSPFLVHHLGSGLTT